MIDDVRGEIKGEVERFCRHLTTNCDRQGIFRYSPQALEKELLISLGELEEMLQLLYTREYLVYVTRINKDTGEIKTDKNGQTMYEVVLTVESETGESSPRNERCWRRGLRL